MFETVVFFNLSISVEISITSFKSVCGRMSVDSKSEVILDEKLFGDHFKKKFLKFFILNLLVPLLRSALNYLFNFVIVIWNFPQLECQPRWLVRLKLGAVGLVVSCENGLCLVHCSFLVSALQGKISNHPNPMYKVNCWFSLASYLDYVFLLQGEQIPFRLSSSMMSWAWVAWKWR